MASISISGWKNEWTSAGDRAFTLEVTEQSYDPVANTSVVKWKVSVTGGNNQSMDTYIYASVNGTAVINEWLPATPDGGVSWSGFPANVGTRSNTMVINHGSDGKKEVSFYLEGYAVVYSTKSSSGSLTLHNIDRTDPVVTQADISNIDVTSFTISATSDVTCNSWEYSLNNGSSWTVFSTTDGTSASTSVTGLAMNTTYTVLIRAKKTLNGLYGVSGSKSAKTLGASVVDSISTSVEIGKAQDLHVSWTPLDESFKFKLRFSCGEWSDTTSFITNGGVFPTVISYLGDIPETVCYQLPNSLTGTLTVELITFTEDEIQVGSSDSKTTKLIVPDSIVPSIRSVTLQEGTASGFNEYVKSLSTIRATVDANGAYGSTIESIKVRFGDLSYKANVSGIATSDILQTAGTMTVVTTVTDSRGRTRTNTKTITVYDYWKPTATIEIARNGTTVVTTVAGSIAPVNPPANPNTKSLVITRKRLSDNTTETYPVNPLPEYDYAVMWTQTISDIETESYEYTVAVTDTKQTIIVKQQTAIICISRLAGGRGVAFFEEASKEGFWIHDIQHDITQNEYLEMARLLAKNYSTSSAYYVGQFCIYNSTVWECNTPIVSGETWNSNHWTALGAA